MFPILDKEKPDIENIRRKTSAVETSTRGLVGQQIKRTQCVVCVIVDSNCEIAAVLKRRV
jgi:hypothetical protein